MRFLADAGVSTKTVELLQQLGHEAVHVRTLGLQRATHPDLIDRARADSSIVVTFDLDFGDMLALGVLDSPSVIIFRLGDERPDSVNQRLSTVLAERLTELELGSLILVEDARVSRQKAPDWPRVVPESLCKNLYAVPPQTAQGGLNRRTCGITDPDFPGGG